MPPRSGRHTGEFGCWLTQYLAGTNRYHDYIVYYDHGDSQAESNVAVIHGFRGSEVTNVTRLAGVDVMVATPDGDLVLLIEIEESAMSPKKLLGDLMAILMCGGFAVKTDVGHQYFRIGPDTCFIVAGVVSLKGSKLRKLTEVIAPRLAEFGRLNDAIDPGNVSLLFESDIQTTIATLMDLVRAMLPEKVRE